MMLAADSLLLGDEGDGFLRGRLVNVTLDSF